MESVLNAAMLAFWKGGYHATSMSDLEQATSLKRGSLYKAFPDKRSLFLATLEHYGRQSCERLDELGATAHSPLQAIRMFLEGAADAFSRASSDKGCFFVNTITEVSPHDPEIAEAVKRAVQNNEERLRKLVKRAKKAGEVSASVKSRSAAKQLVYSLAGIQVAGKNQESPKVLDALIDHAMAAIAH